MEILRQIQQILNDVPAEAWGELVNIVVSAFIVSPVALAIKKWFSVDGEKKMVALVMAGSVLAAAGAYLMSVPEFAPYIILITGGLTFATTQPVYYFFVKPVFTRISAWFAAEVAKAATQTEAQAAAVPAEGLPISSKPKLIDDFSN